jgi:signal transduction histidine kinase
MNEKGLPAGPMGREKFLEETVPQFEQFIENRESYIRALEQTIDALKRENSQFNRNNLDIRTSIDELVVMQRLSNAISTAVEPELIVGTLIELTQQVLPVLESNVFLFDLPGKRLLPLTSHGSDRLVNEAHQHLESGIIDWVFSEKKTVIIPDLANMVGEGSPRNFVIVPLILRNENIGIYIIHTPKPQQEFTNQDMQLLSVLANQAAAGVENWRTHHQLVRANEELKSSQAQMIQAGKLVALGELAAGIVHEIKNPVQILLTHVDLVMRGNPMPGWVDLFNKEVHRLAEITRRLMTFSHTVSDDPRLESVDLNKALDDIVAIVQHDLRNNKVLIKKEFGESLPSIMGNTNYLQQAFMNLLINARDAMPQGGTVTVKTEHKDLRVMIDFTDTGTGIAKEHLDRIFSPFFTTKEPGKGTGLGLSMCKKIVSQHHGEIKVTSEVNVGTTFTIILPVRSI